MTKQKKTAKEHIINLFIVLIILMYLALLFKIVLFKMVSPMNLIQNGINTEFRGIELIPFADVFYFLVKRGSLFNLVKNIMGNIGIFIPFGILIPMLFEEVHKRTVIFYGFMFSVCFELCQYIFALGISDINDVILNTFGAVIGVSIYGVLDNKFKVNVSKKLWGIATLGTIGVVGVVAIYFINASVLTELKYEYFNEEVLGDVTLENETDSGMVATFSGGKLSLMNPGYIDDDGNEEEATNAVYDVDEETKVFLVDKQDVFAGNALVKVNVTYSKVDINNLDKCLRDEDTFCTDVWTDESGNALIVAITKFSK